MYNLIFFNFENDFILEYMPGMNVKKMFKRIPNDGGGVEPVPL